MGILIGAERGSADIFSPFKSTLFMIKSISQSFHNAETDIKTDIELPGRICSNQLPLEHGYARSAAHST